MTNARADHNYVVNAILLRSGNANITAAAAT